MIILIFLIQILTKSSLYTPTTAKGTLDGFNIGPNMLNTVFTFSFFLTGLTIFMAGWYLGAIINPIPPSFTHLVTPWVKEKTMRNWINIGKNHLLRILALFSYYISRAQTFTFKKKNSLLDIVWGFSGYKFGNNYGHKY